MGWTCFNLYNGEKTADVIKREFEQTRIEGQRAGFGFEYMATRGSTVYAIMWRDSMAADFKPEQRAYFGMVFLTARKVQGGFICPTTEFCYKDMDESMGPNAYDAPKKMLDLLDKLAPNPEGQYATKWREACRDKLAAKKYARTPKTGERVEYGGMAYTLVSPAGPRRGWHVKTDKGAFYRMTAKQITAVMAAQRKPPEPEPTFTKQVTPEQFFKDTFQIAHTGA